MSAHGLEVFDKTLQTTHDWLNDIRPVTGGDRKLAWRVLGVVLTELRAALPRDLAAHLGAELPILVRGAYYQDHRPAEPPRRDADLAGFLGRIGRALAGSPPLDVAAAAGAVLATLTRHVPREMTAKVQAGLPAHLRSFWAEAARGVVPPPEKGGLGPYSAGGRGGAGPSSPPPDQAPAGASPSLGHEPAAAARSRPGGAP